MKFKEMQSLIDDVIENEFTHIEEKKENMNYKELQAIKEIKDYFKEKLSEEDYNKIILLQDELFEQILIKEKYYFNRGVRSAFNNLKFLEKHFDVF